MDIKYFICVYFYFTGAVSDGEFNSLRTQGATRPVHLWQLIHDVKASVKRQSAKTLLAMLVKICGKFIFKIPAVVILL